MARNDTPDGTPQDVLPVSREAILEQFGQMIAAVPDAEDDDGSGIIAGVLMATTWEAVNTEDSLPNAEKLVGVRQRINGISKRRSDIEGGLPWYLVVDAMNADTGEVIKWQTSSDTVTAQLVKLAFLGALPCVATVVKRDKPTKAGFYPLSLRVHAGTTAR